MTDVNIWEYSDEPAEWYDSPSNLKERINLVMKLEYLRVTHRNTYVWHSFVFGNPKQRRICGLSSLKVLHAPPSKSKFKSFWRSNLQPTILFAWNHKFDKLCDYHTNEFWIKIFAILPGVVYRHSMIHQSTRRHFARLLHSHNKRLCLRRIENPSLR